MNAANYTLDSLVAELDLQLNRFYMDKDYDFYICNQTGQKHDISVKSGLHTPATLVASINQQLFGAFNNHDIQLAYAVAPDNTCSFVFQSNSATLRFSLFFLDDQAAQFAQRIGFYRALYNGKSRYASNIVFEYPNTQPTIYSIGRTDSNHLVITPACPPIVTGNAQVDSATSTVRVSTDVAHGFRVSDLALITVMGPAPTAQYIVCVSSTESSGVVSFSAGVLPLSGSFPIIMAPYSPSQTSFLFAPRTDCIHASVLGVCPLDAWWTVDSPGTFSHPFPTDLEGWRYALLEMVSPPGLARIEHMGPRQQVKRQLIGKLINLRNDLNLERFFQMTATFYSDIVMTQLHLRLLNPDYSLYKLHGREWSMTIRLYLK